MASTYSKQTQTQHTEGGSTSTTSAIGQVDDMTNLGYFFSKNPYQQSQSVTNAYNQLQNALNNKPGEFSSKYATNLSNIYNQIMNRPAFNYNMNEDATYQMYKDNYMSQGKQAMKDTVAAGSALTGGYGNSYAQTAGQQAYQSYLQQLNDMVPQLQQQAYQKYQDETSNLYNQADLTNNLYNQDYKQYRDKVSDYQADRNYYTDYYNNERNFDYNQFNDNRNYYSQEYWNQRNAIKQTDSRDWKDSTTTSETTSTSSGGSSGGSSGSSKKSSTKNANTNRTSASLDPKSHQVLAMKTLNAEKNGQSKEKYLAGLMDNGEISMGDYLYFTGTDEFRKNSDNEWTNWYNQYKQQQAAQGLIR